MPACLKIVEAEPSQRLDTLLLLLDQGEACSIELAVSREIPIIIDERKERARNKFRDSSMHRFTL